MKFSFDFKKDYVILDLETTGLSTRTDEIIQIAALKIRDNKIQDQLNLYVKPTTSIPKFVVDLTGIHDEDLKNCKCINDVLDDVIMFINDDPVMGHNIMFDVSFLNSIDENKQIKSTVFYDTCELSKIVLPYINGRRLVDLATHYGINNEDAHDALGDCLLTYHVYNSMILDLKNNNVLL